LCLETETHSPALKEPGYEYDDTQLAVPAAAAGTYNVYRDPRELHPLIGHSLWTGASFQDMAVRHMMAIRKYPHNKLGKGKPYVGIENLRPESKEIVETFMSWQSGK